MTPPPILQDRPEEDPQQLWPGLSAFSQRLAEIIERLPPTSPVLISGDWGAGKTTLLKAVQRELGLDAAGNERAIWFDAWRYEGQADLLPALMRAVWEQAPQTLRDDDRAKARYDALLRAAIVVSVRAFPALLTAVGVPLVGDILQKWTTAALDKETESVDTGLKRLQIPDDPVAAVRREFAALIDAGWPAPDGGAGGEDRRPVIFIDDLDRCSPAGAVALLDQLRALVADAHALRCRFVVAMDRRVLTRAISAKFESLGGYDGNRYLEKLFPLAFDLPALQATDARRLIDQFLGEASDRGRDHRDALSNALGRPAFANPRLMKRCINRYRLTLHFERGFDTPAPDAKSNRRLAHWIAAIDRWPALRRLMTLHADDAQVWEDLGAILRRKPDAPDPIPAELQALVSQEGCAQWLKQELFPPGSARVAEYRAADRRLRRWGL